ncbi:MAG: Ig-like domain-containing protein, partial [Deltaproteobacteria bacterium]|nr:Ig-like domain-containing protein [Deltaproteobacteria bacterium]
MIGSACSGGVPFSLVQRGDAGVPGDPVPQRLEKVAGDLQSASVGTALPISPQVRVLDSEGNPVPGFALSFQVEIGGGSVGSAKVVTDAQGLAASSFTLGTVAGENRLVVAPVLGALSGAPKTVSFSALGFAAAADHLEKEAGDLQSAMVGTRVLEDPQVRVVDSWGNPVPGFALSFEVSVGGGRVGAATASTDPSGLASTSFTLGPVAGDNVLAVGPLDEPLPGTPGTVTFLARGTTGAADRLEKVAGDLQSARVGTAVAVDPQVRVVDALGNPVAGFP